jgi:hypothetical protein
VRLAIDVDGVLADWNTGFLKALRETSGRYLGPSLLPQSYFLPPTWDWPEALGYTPDEIARAWAHTREEMFWWSDLRALPGAGAFLSRLSDVQNMEGWEVYFITSRGCHEPNGTGFIKQQTEEWLEDLAVDCPTVIVRAQHKGDICAALRLDGLIDDKPSHLHEARRACGAGFRTWLRAAPYNVEPLDPEVRVLHTLDEFWEDL